MATAMFAETLDNFSTFDEAHPRKPTLHMFQGTRVSDQGTYKRAA
jgi:hypothetical protein